MLEGNSTEQVIAVPFEGYVFTGWAGSLERTPERVIKNVKESQTYVACFEKKQLDIQYLATENGSIGGETTQKVVYGENAQTVTAIPKEGYMFSGWSDNITTAERQDTQVKESICVTANFERLKKEFTFDYNYATENCEKKDILLTYGELQDVKFPVPVREHFTFNGWYLGNAPVSDSAGNPVIGNEIFYNNRTDICAKWTPNETFTYKILFVYVTDVVATVPSADNKDVVNIRYKMPKRERALCELITEQMRVCMNELLDGLVKFEIDEYYTTQPVLSEDVKQTISGGCISNYVSASSLSEVQQLIGNYQCVITTCNFNDYESLTNNLMSFSTEKYSTVFFEGLVANWIRNGGSFESLFDYNNAYWNNMRYSYVNAILHAIEMQVKEDIVPSTIVQAEYIKQWTSDKGSVAKYQLTVAKLYFLCQAVIEEKKVGIPYTFWSGQFD